MFSGKKYLTKDLASDTTQCSNVTQLVNIDLIFCVSKQFEHMSEVYLEVYIRRIL